MGVLTNMLRLNNVDSDVEMMIKAVIMCWRWQSSGREKRHNMKRQLLAAFALACALFSAGSAAPATAESGFFRWHSANNAEPYRAMQNALMQKLWAQYPDVKLVISDAQQDNSKQVAQVKRYSPEAQPPDSQ